MAWTSTTGWSTSSWRPVSEPFATLIPGPAPGLAGPRRFAVARHGRGVRRVCRLRRRAPERPVPALHHERVSELRGRGPPGRQDRRQGRTTRIKLAPGMNLGQGEVNQIAHHAVLGHGLGVQTIRARGLLGTKVEPAEVMFCGVPAIDAPSRDDRATPRRGRDASRIDSGESPRTERLRASHPAHPQPGCRTRSRIHTGSGPRDWPRSASQLEHANISSCPATSDTHVPVRPCRSEPRRFII
jgi:hypothetical protein